MLSALLTNVPLERHVWLLGHPVGHSLSPVMHNAAFRHLGLQLRYDARDVSPMGLSEAIAELHSPQCLGANLTIPHKETALALLDDVDERALAIGAVNTVLNGGGRLHGYNTDIDGFEMALGVLARDGIAGAECLVLGAGGAARSVVAGLVEMGAATVWVANRTPERAKALCLAARSWGGSICTPIDWSRRSDIAVRCLAIVNATSMGLPHSVKNLPLDVDILRDGQIVYDLVYGPGSTPLVRAARAKGLAAADGIEMLIHQAALSFRIWTGVDAPIDVMRSSLDNSQH